MSVLALAGCAKLPSVAPGDRTARVFFTLNFDGAIRTGQEPGSGGVPYVYMVAIHLSQDAVPTTLGPVPVIAQPWGNGFVAGDAEFFVWWDPTQAAEYTIYRFLDTSLQQWFATGVPITIETVQNSSKRMRFEIALSQLIADPVEAAKIKTIQVNLLSMDRVPQSGSNKLWEALGDGRIPSQINSPITIPITSSGTYNNLRANNLEPRGDQIDPALDLVDWTVEVRLD